jgi:hypothetical protein
MTPNLWLSITEVAALAGVTAGNVGAAIRRGTLRARRVVLRGRRVLGIRRADAEAYGQRIERKHVAREEVRALIAAGITPLEAARRVGVPHATAYRLRKHLSKEKP